MIVSYLESVLNNDARGNGFDSVGIIDVSAAGANASEEART